jgi:hypothetical protein
LKARTLSQLGEMICGNSGSDQPNYFLYRSSWYLTEFFQDIGTDYQHDGSTRHRWVADVLAKILDEEAPLAGPNTPPDTFARVIRRLMDQEDAVNEEADRRMSLGRRASKATAWMPSPRRWTVRWPPRPRRRRTRRPGRRPMSGSLRQRCRRNPHPTWKHLSARRRRSSNCLSLARTASICRPVRT